MVSLSYKISGERVFRTSENQKQLQLLHCSACIYVYVIFCYTQRQFQVHIDGFQEKSPMCIVLQRILAGVINEMPRNNCIGVVKGVNVR